MQEAFDPRFGEAWTQRSASGMLALPGVWLTIAELDGVAAGFAMARAIARRGRIAVARDAPCGPAAAASAQALLRSVIAEARTRGAASMHLEVRAGNDADRALSSCRI